MPALSTARHSRRAGAHTSRARQTLARASAGEAPLLLRVARGEEAERAPVWLMRQAGRYMAAFRQFSDKYPFRMRSETPDIATELSLQPYNAYKPDGVIFFSDILTPLPSMGIEFDVIKGKGPQIDNVVRDMDAVRALTPIDDPDSQTPFIRPILSALRSEIDADTTLLGFIGTPWTLAAYSVEGSADRHLKVTKSMMHTEEGKAVLHALLSHLADNLVAYCVHQIDSGAQVLQLFDSWAHHLSPAQFREFSLPYAERVMAGVRAARPGVPLIFHANGGAGKEAELFGDSLTSDVVGLDWNQNCPEARSRAGESRVLQGNVDPMVLFGDHDVIEREVKECLAALQNKGGNHHILNVGHGVVQGTPEEAVGHFIDTCKACTKVTV